MIRKLLTLAMVAVLSVGIVGCDDDDAEIETPGGKVEIDR